MTTPENTEDLNSPAFAKWKAIVENKPRYVAFVDGDLVDKGSNYVTVAINASGLRSQRGEDAQMNVFDSESGTSTSR